jgi:hypothetical protein
VREEKRAGGDAELFELMSNSVLMSAGRKAADRFIDDNGARFYHCPAPMDKSGQR